MSLSTICYNVKSIEFGRSIRPRGKEEESQIHYIQEMEGGDGQGLPNNEMAGLRHGGSSRKQVREKASMQHVH